jgi:hypothetical protein
MGTVTQVLVVHAGAVKSVPNEGFSQEWGNVKFGFGRDGADFKNIYDHLRSQMGGTTR